MSHPGPDQIADQVRRFLAGDLRPQRDPSFYEDDLSLISSGLMDSVAIARLITFLERAFPIEFVAWEVSAEFLDSVGLIAGIVHEKLEGG